MPVVHCKKEPFDVYIGRPGPWGNPFQIGKDGNRQEVIAKYKQYLWKRINTEGTPLLDALAQLDGKTLGCWCSPQPCHGDILLAAAAYAKKQ